MNTEQADTSLWKHRIFQQLFWAHALSLFGTGLSSLALGLLAHELVGASASKVLGITLAIRIVVIVIFSPWAGQVAARWGQRQVMIFSDIMRCFVLAGFYFADAVWQIYVLAFFLNLGSALFTPIYRAMIPSVVTPAQYPRAAAIGSIAYDSANILSPSIAAVAIALIGFRGNFILDAVTFILSAILIVAIPRIAFSNASKGGETPLSGIDGISAMFKRAPLRESILLALQTSVGGAFVIVATIDLVKNDLKMNDSAYAWIMAAFGVGSVLGATIYAKLSNSSRNVVVRCAAPAMILALVSASLSPTYFIVMVAWVMVGMAYSILGVRGSELLAANSSSDERAHVFAAHFALSHAGWGATYPLVGFLTTSYGFTVTGWTMAVILALITVPLLLRPRTTAVPEGGA